MHKEFSSKSPAQALAHVIEECGEVISAYGKGQRFGPYSFNPLLPLHQQETNAEWLERELLDLRDTLDIYLGVGGSG